MKLKKILATVLAAVAAFATLGMVACNKDDTSKNVKVMKDILLTEEEYAFAIAKENTTLLSEVNSLLATWTNSEVFTKS